MLADNEPNAKIVKYTGLSISEIEALKSSWLVILKIILMQF
jgi:hypothetical protein